MEAPCRNVYFVKEHPSPYRYPQRPRTPPNSFAWSLSREGPHQHSFKIICLYLFYSISKFERDCKIICLYRFYSIAQFEREM